MNSLLQITKNEDIIDEYKGTPISLLLEYQNLGRPYDEFENAQLIIGTCIDFRIMLNTPRNFSFVVRSGGANMDNDGFFLSFAISTAQIKHIALIGHNHCGMSNIEARKGEVINGLVKTAGMGKTQAEEHFENSISKFEIGNEVDFILRETNRLRSLYPKIQVAPLFYLLEDNKLYLIDEK